MLKPLLPALLPALLALLPFSAANAKESCAFLLHCELEGRKFSLDFRSASGSCAEDDMAALFKSGEDSHGLKLPPNWYFYTDHIAKTQPSLCKGADQQNGFAAYASGGKKALLFLKTSGRPGYDRITALLLDPEKGEVLDHRILGSSKNSFVAVLKNGNGFKLRLIRDSLSFPKEVSCDCDAPYVDDWMQVSVVKGKIAADWLGK